MKFNNKFVLIVGALIVAAFVLTACGAPGPAGPEGPAGPQGDPGPAPAATDLTCTECHDEAGTISAKKAGWALSKHGNGTAMLEEYSNKSCAFCHSGNTFSAGIAAGQNFTQLEAGASEPARQDCRACHQIHTSYTGDDWALETTAPVAMVVSGATFDGGNGNLCVNCHQFGGHPNEPRYNRVSTNLAQGCVNCHNRIHGSNHPSGSKFAR